MQKISAGLTASQSKHENEFYNQAIILNTNQMEGTDFVPFLVINNSLITILYLSINCDPQLSQRLYRFLTSSSMRVTSE